MNMSGLTLSKAGGLHTLTDYHHLYRGQWKNSMPDGPAPGVMSNFTSDLLFAMERLSVNPYAVKRVHPTAQGLPFRINDTLATKISGWTLDTLHRNGHLFVADHSYQAKYPTAEGKYTAACTAYFFIHPKSGQFLPLAIKTNVGANLVYTPLDEEGDWLLAKAMFNQNDLFHGQIFHLANSHAVVEVAYLAALRTLSDKHPVLVLLKRLMHQAYAIRPVGERVLFNSEGLFDKSFAITNIGVRMFATEFYPTVAGPFRANYLHRELVSRGLIECVYGPALASVPFYQDASALLAAIRRFMTTFVSAYYASERVLALDHELQAWVREATEHAGVIDFPEAPLVHRDTLVDVLAHAAFLTGVSHHVLNSGEPFGTSGMLPLHPAALYQPIPTKKGLRPDELMGFLPPFRDAVDHVALLAFFNRPVLESEHRTLAYMFSGSQLEKKGSDELVRAARVFVDDMLAISRGIQERNFDEQGLSQGMPFVWRALDPAKIPYFLSV